MKSSSSEDGLNGSLQLLHAHVRLVGVPATWRSQAQTSMRAELPSGKLYNLHRCGLLSPFEKKFTDNALLIVEAQIVFLIYFTSRMLFENRHLACFICRYLYLILMRLDNL